MLQQGPALLWCIARGILTKKQLIKWHPVPHKFGIMAMRATIRISRDRGSELRMRWCWALWISDLNLLQEKLHGWSLGRSCFFRLLKTGVVNISWSGTIDIVNMRSPWCSVWLWGNLLVSGIAAAQRYVLFLLFSVHRKETDVYPVKLLCIPKTIKQHRNIQRMPRTRPALPWRPLMQLQSSIMGQKSVAFQCSTSSLSRA